VSDRNNQGNLRCRQCDKVQNPRDQGLPYGDYSTQCRGGGSIHRRHNRLKIFFIILPRRPATVPRWKLRISYQAASSVLETFTCRLVMAAWQLHMTSPWSRLLWNTFCRLRGGCCRTQESRTLREQLRWSGDRLYSAGEGEARWMVYPGGQDTQPPADRKGLQRATCRSALFRELGIAIQRSIARDIIERSGRLPEHVSAQLST
jgi:hypothetical protein